MLTQDTAAAALDAALRSGGDFAEIFLEDRRNNALTMRSGRIETVNSNRLHGAGIRVYSGLSSVYVYTNDTSLEGLMACAKTSDSAAQIADTGSAEAQIALFTYRIKHLTEHLKENHKDHVTARSLTMMVGRRRKLLKYLYNVDINRYRAIVKSLGLRK